jgi:hypothetical protein
MKKYYRIIQVEDGFIPQYKSWFFGFWKGISPNLDEFITNAFQWMYCMHQRKSDALITIENHQKLIKFGKKTVVHKETFKL